MTTELLRKISTWVMIYIAILLIVWDIVAVVFGGGKSTESSVLRDTAYRVWILPFTMGVLCGHWFWNPVNADNSKLGYLVVIAFLLIGRDAAATIGKWQLSPWYVVALLPVLGFFAGHFCWPQSRI